MGFLGEEVTARGEGGGLVPRHSDRTNEHPLANSLGFHRWGISFLGRCLALRQGCREEEEVVAGGIHLGLLPLLLLPVLFLLSPLLLLPGGEPYRGR